MKIRFALAVVLSLVLLSCDRCEGDKNPDSETVNELPDVVHMVRRISYDTEASGVCEFEYDSHGRLVRVWFESSLQERTPTMAYQYGGDYIKVMLHDEKPVDLKFESGYLCEDWMDGHKYYEFRYNDSGVLSGISDCEDGHGKSFVWNDGNLISMIDHKGDAEHLEYTEYPNDYSIDFGLGLGLYSCGIPAHEFMYLRFPGITSRNLVSRSYNWFVCTSHEMSYEFDEKGRVSAITVRCSER